MINIQIEQLERIKFKIPDTLNRVWIGQTYNKWEGTWI